MAFVGYLHSMSAATHALEERWLFRISTTTTHALATFKASVEPAGLPTASSDVCLPMKVLGSEG